MKDEQELRRLLDRIKDDPPREGGVIDGVEWSAAPAVSAVRLTLEWVLEEDE